MKKNIKVLIAGDIFPTSVNEQYFIEEKMDELVDARFMQLFREADYSICNLEGCLTDDKGKKNKSGVKVRASQSAVNGFKQLGFHAVSLANNHTLDFGAEGFENCTAALTESGIDMVGAGADEKSVITHKKVEIGGHTLIFYCVAETLFNVPGKKTPGANVYEEYRVLKELQELKPQCDYLIVLYHGGAERIPTNTPWIRQRFHRMADSGADIIISQHTHAIGLEEHYNGAYLLYGQGNFLFHLSKKITLNGYGLLLELNIDEKGLNIKKHVAKRVDPGIVYDEDYDMSSFEILTERNAAGDDFAEEFSAYAAKNAYRFLSSFRGIVPEDARKEEELSKSEFNEYLKRCYNKAQLLTILKYLEAEEFREYAIRGIKDMIEEDNRLNRSKSKGAAIEPKKETEDDVNA